MRSRPRWLTWILSITAWLALCPLTANADDVDYLKQVKPLLAARCGSCHGALAQKARLRLDTAALARKGGRNGPAIVPGKSAESLLIQAVRGKDHDRMPPENDGAALTKEQVDLLRAWIDQGAIAPTDEPVPQDPRRHWAFQTPVRPSLPKVSDPDWAVNPIDTFVRAELERNKLGPNPVADKSVLLRRVTLDLTGLPPTREQLHAFLKDTSPDAYEKVVDRLLSSPEYGERWARHWMDVWRYSDWYGRRQERDWRNSSPTVWRWRDWIVHSLNADAGYDRMIREMLAADEIAPEDDAAQAATGFLVRNYYSLNFDTWMKDQVEHTAKAFLGLTLNCCHCHDHKYDPISQEEYFRFRAFFEPIGLRQDRVKGEPDPGPFKKYDYASSGKVLDSGLVRVLDERPDAKTRMYKLGNDRDFFPDREPVSPAAPACVGVDKLTIRPVSLPPVASYPGLKAFVREEETARLTANLATATAELAKTPADALAPSAAQAADLPPRVAEVLAARCLDCHDSATKKGGFDLEVLVAGKLPDNASDPAAFRKWIRVHDRVRDGEMPPKNKLAPDEQAGFLKALSAPLVAAETKSRKAAGRSTLRRLNRTEYENTLRDLLGVPGLDVRDLLPEDGRVFGYDKSGPALEFSTVQINKYLDAADKALPLAVAPYPDRDKPVKVKWYLGDNGGIMDRAFNADAAPLKNFKFDTDLMPIPQNDGISGYALFEGLRAQGKIPYRGAIGILRNDVGDSWKVELGGFSPVVPGLYRVRISMWGFLWDKGEVKPTTTQIGQLINDQRGRIGSFTAPSLKPTVSEVVTWMNPGECLTFRAGSVVQALPGSRFLGKEKKGLLGFTSDGIAIDWVEVEGPLTETWPGVGHRRMFGDLPLALFDEKSGLKKPARPATGQFRGGCLPEKTGPQNQLWTVTSKDPTKDAERLLTDFLPLAFRRPVEPDEVREFAALALARLKGKVTFEEAMLTAYKAALCSPDFLYLTGPVGKLDDHALASRLSYFLWATMPDDELFRLAKEKKLSDPKVLRAQTERMLRDPKAERFVTDFTNQWLDLRLIDDNTPHDKLYPEFRPLLRDAMAEEPRAFFRELLGKDLPAANIVHSDFAMLNQTLAEFYGDFSVEDHTIPQEKPRPRQPRDTLPQPVAPKEPVLGAEFRRVPLPADSQRGGFLTMAAVLKVTANGTTTSPVRRGAWVQRKIVGRPPEPPPPNIPAAEPDTRGLTTIREVLAKHRDTASCAACHAKIDPPGFALESYDPIGGFRSRYRSLEKGDRITQAPRGSGYGPEFRLGLPVDASGELADGRRFADIRAFKQLLLKDEPQIARNFAEQLLVYATGAPVSFADRAAVDRILAETAGAKHGIRSIVHAVVQSELFRNK